VLVDLPNTDDAREKILRAAVALLAEHGLRRLTQPQVAEKAGVRQSHVTYYFPLRSDLIGAVARRYIESAALEVMALIQGAAEDELAEKLLGFAQRQIRDQGRARTLLGLLVASEEDAGLREQMVQAMTNLRGVIAHAMGVPPQDPTATLMQAALWGLGLNHLLMGGGAAETKVLVEQLARQSGLKRRKDRR
jgi:AcrR family transcriptional regulator